MYSHFGSQDHPKAANEVSAKCSKGKPLFKKLSPHFLDGIEGLSLELVLSV